jgi:hypothetical protein
MQREREINRFRAKSEDGREYIIIEFPKKTETKQWQSESKERTSGSKNLYTSTGLHVEYIDSRTFKIIETGEIVRKV